MTPEEIGEYVKNSVLKSIENGGSTTEFLFITTGADAPDICLVGNGPRRAFHAHLIAAAPALLSLVERYASECKCGGTGIGRVVHSVQGGEIIETGLACEDCADIRAAIASAKGDK
jgi:hypothetical protein